MAWIVLVVGFVLVTDMLLLGRLRRWVARSRAPMLRQRFATGAVQDRIC
jgi:hypothetical protein